MSDCCHQEECLYSVCVEQEIADRVRAELEAQMDIFEGNEMAKFIIRWNAGYGDNYDEVEAATHDEAVTIAYESWRDDVESNADYGAEPYTEELAEDYGL